LLIHFKNIEGGTAVSFSSRMHHRQSLRLRNRDYSHDGYYFITICTRNRENLFADFCVGVGLAPTPDHIISPLNGRPRGSPLHQGMVPTPNFAPELILTVAGQIIEKNWRKIADHNVKTDAFVIMPNHIHGIIIINSHYLRVGARLALAPDIVPAPDSVIIDQGQPRGLPQQKTIPTLGDIIGAFKSRCALEYLKFIDEHKLNESGKIWQRNYYEHIIRDRKELAAIRNYIKTNPDNWSKDEENPMNL
jgi:putative transposase